VLIKLSIVIPCYNELKNLPLLLDRCVQVVTRSDIEIVLVDNGSTDNSYSFLNDQLANFSFITLAHVKQNQGYGNGILEGLKKASGEILAWTHADMQTDPADIIRGLEYFESTSDPTQVFAKGRRSGRPISDTFFTVGMSAFETLLMRTFMWDINAQPTMFHRSFYERWEDPPKDFSLDLYAYFMAKTSGLKFRRFPVYFKERAFGVSHWNFSLAGKYKFIKRTLSYSFELIRKLKSNA
jgi:glycosyltransferase involved in cell wall biosynthesis